MLAWELSTHGASLLHQNKHIIKNYIDWELGRERSRQRACSVGMKTGLEPQNPQQSPELGSLSVTPVLGK